MLRRFTLRIREIINNWGMEIKIYFFARSKFVARKNFIDSELNWSAEWRQGTLRGKWWTGSSVSSVRFKDL